MRISTTLYPLFLITLNEASAYKCGTTVIRQLPNIGLGLNEGILGETLQRTPACCKTPGTVILGADDNCRPIDRKYCRY
jgi:hypothetical protein